MAGEDEESRSYRAYESYSRHSLPAGGRARYARPRFFQRLCHLECASRGIELWHAFAWPALPASGRRRMLCFRRLGHASRGAVPSGVAFRLGRHGDGFFHFSARLHFHSILGVCVWRYHRCGGMGHQSSGVQKLEPRMKLNSPIILGASCGLIGLAIALSGYGYVVVYIWRVILIMFPEFRNGTP